MNSKDTRNPPCATSRPHTTNASPDQQDFRHTLGWRISPHARETAQRRGVTPRAVLAVVADPQITYPSRGRVLMVRGRLAIVTDVRAQVVVTVLARLASQWDDATARRFLRGV